jgi:hypothetical protein
MSWALTEDRTARTAPAREGLQRKFELQVDPEGKLPPAERAKRAENARKAFYLNMAAKSAAVRSRRKRAAESTSAADIASAKRAENARKAHDLLAAARRKGGPAHAT